MKKIEQDADFNSFAFAIQILLIPHSIRLDFTNDNDEKYLEELMGSCFDYITIVTRDRKMRLLRGIKTVKDKHDYVNLTLLDPEVPEAYSAKVLLQLTQGFLRLVKIEENYPKRELWNLLCTHWIENLISCTEFWIGNDSSPVINLKGKILLNFLCELKIPGEKLTDWLTDKNSDFQKCIDSL